MLIHRAAILAAVKATDKDDDRYFLKGCQITPDGSIGATNGHWAFRATPVAAIDTQDAPIALLPEGTTEPTAPILVSAAQLTAAAKATPKNGEFVVQRHVSVRTDADGKLTLCLAMNGTSTHRSSEPTTEAHFPDITRIIPKRDPVFCGSFDARLLRDVCDAFIGLAEADGSFSGRIVKIRLEMQGTAKADECLNASAIYYEPASGYRAVAVVMPVRP